MVGGDPRSYVSVEGRQLATDAESVSTESVDVTQQQIQVVGANGSLYETIEPSSTTTPIQDGLGIGTNNSEEVVVLLPPTEIDEAGTITFDRYSKGVIGHGHGFRNAAGADNPPVGPSIINFSNDANGFEFSGSSAQGDWPSGFRIEGFAMMGVNPDGSRPSGTAFLFDDADQMKPHSFYIGDIAGYYWHKIIRWTGGNAPWQCEFGPLFFDNVDAGNPSNGNNAIFDLQADNPPMHFRYVAIWPRNLGSGANSNIFHNEAKLTVEALNIGGDTTGKIFKDPGSGGESAMLQCGPINYEPNSQSPATKDTLINMGGARPVSVFGVRVSGNVNANYVYEINRGFTGGHEFGPVLEPDQLGQNVVKIDAALDSSVTYHGTREDIDYLAGRTPEQKFINPLGSRGYPVAEVTGQTLSAGGTTTISLGISDSEFSEVHEGGLVVDVTNTGSITSNYGVTVDKIWHDDTAGTWQVNIAETETPSTAPTADVRYYAN